MATDEQLLHPIKNENKRHHSALSDDESASSKKSKQGASSSFVPKLYQMVDTNSDNLISWNLAGNSFIVANLKLFSSQILPTHFKHSNFSSFVRQLNMYGFHKCNKTPRGQKNLPEHQVWEFSHPCFLRGRLDLLDDIKRKVIEQSGGEASASTPSTTRSSDLPSSVALLQLNQSQSNQSIATLNQRVLFLEQQLDHSRSETQCLKDVVKQLYAFLYGTHGGLPFEYPVQLMPGHAPPIHSTPSPHHSPQPQPAQPPIFVTSPDTSTHASLPPYPYSPSLSSAGTGGVSVAASPVPDMTSAQSSPYPTSEYNSSYGAQPLSPLSLGSAHHNPQRPMNLSVNTNFNLLQGGAASPTDGVGLGILSPSTSSDRRLSAHSNPHSPHSYSNEGGV